MRFQLHTVEVQTLRVQPRSLRRLSGYNTWIQIHRLPGTPPGVGRAFLGLAGWLRLSPSNLGSWVWHLSMTTYHYRVTAGPRRPAAVCYQHTYAQADSNYSHSVTGTQTDWLVHWQCASRRWSTDRKMAWLVLLEFDAHMVVADRAFESRFSLQFPEGCADSDGCSGICINTNTNIGWVGFNVTWAR